MPTSCTICASTHRHPQLLLRRTALLQPHAQFLRSDGTRGCHTQPYTERCRLKVMTRSYIVWSEIRVFQVPNHPDIVRSVPPLFSPSCARAPAPLFVSQHVWSSFSRSNYTNGLSNGQGDTSLSTANSLSVSASASTFRHERP